MSKQKAHKYDKLCKDLLQQIAAAAPESEPSIYGLAVLTRAGWLQVGCSCFDTHISLCTRFDEPHLARSLVIGMNPYSGKWNHYLQPETAALRVSALFARLWPTSEELPRVQFLGAISRLVESRRKWMLDRYVFGPLAERKHLPVLRQPGVYNSSLSVWAQPGQLSFSDQDRDAFWDCAAEFGAVAAAIERQLADAAAAALLNATSDPPDAPTF